MVLLPALAVLSGAALLVAGAEGLVRGALGLARRAGVSPMLIGLTVVAMGTSAPELVVSVTAAALGEGDVALGNILGSNVLNILIVLGATAAVRAVMVRQATVRRDVPIVVAASAGVYLLALDGRLGRIEGGILVAGAVLYLLHAYSRERPVPSAPDASAPGSVRPATRDAVEGRAGSAGRPDAPAAWLLAVLLIAGGGALVLGGRMLVGGAITIASSLGMSERAIGLTLVAAGTSAPELATSLVAARRGHVDLAVGNVVGSNIMNLLAVLGTTVLVSPLRIGSGPLLVDFPVMLLAAALLLPLARTGMRIGRLEGAFLLLGYAAYVTLLFLDVLPA